MEIHCPSFAHLRWWSKEEVDFSYFMRAHSLLYMSDCRVESWNSIGATAGGRSYVNEFMGYMKNTYGSTKLERYTSRTENTEIVCRNPYQRGQHAASPCTAHSSIGSLACGSTCCHVVPTLYHIFTHSLIVGTTLQRNHRRGSWSGLLGFYHLRVFNIARTRESRTAEIYRKFSHTHVVMENIQRDDGNLPWKYYVVCAPLVCLSARWIWIPILPRPALTEW